MHRSDLLLLLCCPSVLCLFHCVHALLCTAGGECCSFELSEAYSGRFISPPLSLSSGHGESNCGERLPQIDSLNMEGFSQERMHDRILGLSTKQLLLKEQDRRQSERFRTFSAGVCVLFEFLHLSVNTAPGCVSPVNVLHAFIGLLQ